ncbi:MAG: CotH kinase family protein [Eubacteriales bacterium]|nr:CotH kinase family protein [Eubacteriales bacterium]MDD4475064.1 CotH kinase family protein [Eubacteriales bacterium]MDD4476464.1 CotH kinase family protein [Eubacteriales bacterium]
MKKVLFYLILMLSFTLILAACSSDFEDSSAVTSEKTDAVSSATSKVHTTSSDTQSEKDNTSSETSIDGTSSSLSTDDSSSEVSSPDSSAAVSEVESKTVSTVSKVETSKTETSKNESSKTDTSSKSESSNTSSDDSSAAESEPEIKSEIVPRIYITCTADINRDSFIAATLKVNDPSGKYAEISDSSGEVRIRGNSTSSGAKKPYNIKFSESQDLLGLGKAKKWVLLANMYDKSLIRNKLSFDFAANIGLRYTQSTRFVDVYINGAYNGSYLLSEAIDIGQTRVNLNPRLNEFLLEYEPRENYKNPSNIRTPVYNILFGFNAPEFPDSQQKMFLIDFFSKAEKALESKEQSDIEKYFDIPSMVDFYIANELFKNVDFQTSSTRFYIQRGKIYGGPIWDLDLSTGNADFDYYREYNNATTTGDSTEKFYCRGLWYKHFFKCPWFVEKVKARYIELQPIIENLTTDNSLGKNQMDILLIKYSESFSKNFTKWPVNSKDVLFERIPFQTFEENYEYLRTWLIKRNEWLLKEWKISHLK